MLKRDITYEDFDGNSVTEVFYFNISEAEIVEMEVSYDIGLSEMIQQVVKSKDNKTIVKIFKDIILLAYGQKSEDGKRFVKSDQLREEFQQTNAYSALFLELATVEDAAAKFLLGALPRSMAANAQKAIDQLEVVDVNVPPSPPTV